MEERPSDNGQPSAGKSSGAFDLYATITTQITDMLEKGVVPWRSSILGQTRLGSPKNLNTGRPYRGINVFLLAMSQYVKGYETNYWLSFRQCSERGGSVKKGEKSTMVVFWKPIEVIDEKTRERKKKFVLRYYNVFNAEQCCNLEYPGKASFTPSVYSPVEAAEQVLKAYTDGPGVSHGGGQAYYRPPEDKIYIPEPTRFATTAEYYSTRFHEESHATGHSKRLDRKLDKELRPFGSPDYGKEELIAEMSAAFMCGHCGIEPSVIENQAAYISGWLGRLKADKKLLIHAAGAATRSADWILGNRNCPGQSATTTDPEPGDNQIADESESSPQSTVAPSSTSRHPELIDAGRHYLRRGWQVVPIEAGQKTPLHNSWQQRRLGEGNLASAFLGAGNIGLILGEASGGLVDVDLDSPEARKLADQFLPRTAAITGRLSSPASHRWYVSPGVATRQFRDPKTRSSIVELRSTGGQTLIGPSLHPTGEPYDWLKAEPASVPAEQLLSAVQHLAAAVIKQRYGELFTDPTRIPKPVSNRLSTADVSNEQILKRAEAYLDRMEPAISGQGGHGRAYAAATALVCGFRLSTDQALSLLLSRYNPRCQPPWSERELRHKVSDAARLPHLRPPGWLRDAERHTHPALHAAT